MAADLQAPAFTDDTAAREAIEAELWPNGPVCPRCGGMDRIGKVSGKTARPGLYNCAACKRQFTVTVGTIFERSKVPLSKWWFAIHLLATSKKGVSSHQLMRMLGVSYPTAWFMAHRIREAMRSGNFAAPMGGEGAIVEVDETFIGTKYKKPKGARGYAHKHAVLTLVERGGKARSFHVDGTKAEDVLPIIKANIAKETKIMTDEAGQYTHLKDHFGGHEYVRHGAGEYVRDDAHTNTVESFYAVFKRGMKGVYQHCSEKHLHRYVAEFDFRYCHRVKLGVDDKERATKIIRAMAGKRMMYRRADEARPA